MKYSTLFSTVTLASVVVVDAMNRPSSYRRRHLTPFEVVCFPSSAPVMAPTAPSKGKGKGNAYGKGGSSGAGPTTKSPPGGPSPPAPDKNSGKGGPSTSTKSGGSPPKSGGGGTPPSPPKSGGGGGGGSPPSPPKSSGGGGGGGSAYSPGGRRQRLLSQPQPQQPDDVIALQQQQQQQRALQTITLNTTLAAFSGYTSLPAGFTGVAFLTWPNFCFSATIILTNFIPSCVDCSFVVTDGSHSCDPATIPTVTPFIDPTEISFDPYTNSTLFNTDSTGAATVNVPVICTGTGPLDNFERPLLLLDPTGAIAACGILTYQCQ